MEDGRIVNEMVMQFCRKGFRDHLRGIATRWRTYSLTAISVFTVLFTGIQAPAYFLKTDFGDPRLYLGTIIVSLLVALFWTVRAYLNDFPAGFENESQAARRIAQLQRARWEHRLARQLLNDALRDLDDELAALYEGLVFVPVDRRPDLLEYVEWVGMAPANLIRMAEVAQRLIVLELPRALGSDCDSLKAARIRSAVYRIREMYEETVAFERSRRSVHPPEGAEKLHACQIDWTQPIRGGVQQMFQFFEKILSRDKIDGGELAFTVTMGEPPNFTAFENEFDRLQRKWFG